MKGGASRRALSALLCCAMALLATVTDARELSGVTMPESTRVAGRTLRLNGMGLHKEKIFFKVYVAALYLERPTRDPREAITADEGRRMVIVMLRDVDRDAFLKAVEKGMERNTGSVTPALRERLDRLKRALPDLKRGNIVDFTYVPDLGTLVRGQGREMAIPGKDFADAMFSVWLGPKPADPGLKRKLLGR